jgi:hypothetical protein
LALVWTRRVERIDFPKVATLTTEFQAVLMTKPTIVTAVFLAAGLVSADWNPLSAEDRLDRSGVETLKELSRRVEALRPGPEMLRWRQIPWMTDLVAAQRTAKEEKRLLLIWGSGDEPLGRC